MNSLLNSAHIKFFISHQRHQHQAHKHSLLKVYCQTLALEHIRNMGKYYFATSALLATALVGGSCAHDLSRHNESSSSCSQRQIMLQHSTDLQARVAQRLSDLQMGSDLDHELLGQMKKSVNFDAMRPASFPSYLPGMAPGNMLPSLNLPQPQLTQGVRDPTVKTANSPFVMDALGLF